MTNIMYELKKTHTYKDLALKSEPKRGWQTIRKELIKYCKANNLIVPISRRGVKPTKTNFNILKNKS